jgi:hypothetical protein
MHKSGATTPLLVASANTGCEFYIVSFFYSCFSHYLFIVCMTTSGIPLATPFNAPRGRGRPRKKAATEPNSNTVAKERGRPTQQQHDTRSERARKSDSRFNESGDAKRRRLDADRDSTATFRLNESEEEKRRRQDADRDSTATFRLNESEEEKRQRQDADRDSTATFRLNEPEE